MAPAISVARRPVDPQVGPVVDRVGRGVRRQDVGDDPAAESATPGVERRSSGTRGCCRTGCRVGDRKPPDRPRTWRRTASSRCAPRGRSRRSRRTGSRRPVAAARGLGEAKIDPYGARPDRQRLRLARLGGDVGDALSGRRRRVKRRRREIGAIPLGAGRALHTVIKRDAGSRRRRPPGRAARRCQARLRRSRGSSARRTSSPARRSAPASTAIRPSGRPPPRGVGPRIPKNRSVCDAFSTAVSATRPLPEPVASTSAGTPGLAACRTDVDGGGRTVNRPPGSRASTTTCCPLGCVGSLPSSTPPP